MALNDKADQLVSVYVRRQYPELEDGIGRYIQDELQRIEQSINTRFSFHPGSRRSTGKPCQRHGPVRRDRLGPTRQRHYGSRGLHRKRLGCGLIHYT